jgi:pimeloyl-ACP methyl ester carboxylesterase
MPTLVLHGQADAVIPVSAGHWLAEHLPESQCEILAGHGHDLPREVAGEIASRIREFL